MILLVDRAHSEFERESAPANTFFLKDSLGATIPILVSESIVALYIQKIPEELSLFHNWFIKKIDNFYLLLPKKTFDKQKITYQPEVQTITPYEWEIGIKVNHFPDETIENIKNNKTFLSIKYGFERYALPTSTPFYYNFFDKLLSDLLITKKEIREDHAKNQPIYWTFFLLGHGFLESIVSEACIANFSPKELKRVLDFLNSDIETQLLMYSSCFAGGVNKIKVFEEEGKQKIYKFPIIIGSITDKPAHTSIAGIKIQMLFDNLLKQTDRLPDYYKILTESELIDKGSTPSFPQIRLPGTEWFSVETLQYDIKNKKYTVISKTRGLTQEKDMEFSYGASHPILLYSPTVPFTLSFKKLDKTYQLPKILFLVPGNSAYHFKQIDAPHTLWFFSLNLFTPLDSQRPDDNIIYIDKFTMLNSFEPKDYFVYDNEIRESLLSSEKSPFITFTKCIVTLKKVSRFDTLIIFKGTTFDTNNSKPLAIELTMGRTENTKIIPLNYADQFPPAPAFKNLNKIEKAIKNKAALGYIEGKNMIKNLKTNKELKTKLQKVTQQQIAPYSKRTASGILG
jgi:hypothetical protein